MLCPSENQVTKFVSISSHVAVTRTLVPSPLSLGLLCGEENVSFREVWRVVGHWIRVSFFVNKVFFPFFKVYERLSVFMRVSNKRTFQSQIGNSWKTCNDFVALELHDWMKNSAICQRYEVWSSSSEVPWYRNTEDRRSRAKSAFCHFLVFVKCAASPRVYFQLYSEITTSISVKEERFKRFSFFPRGWDKVSKKKKI